MVGNRFCALSLGAIFVVMLAPQAAQATIVTMDFSGTIDTVDPKLTAGNYGNFSAAFTFDTTAPIVGGVHPMISYSVDFSGGYTAFANRPWIGIVHQGTDNLLLTSSGINPNAALDNGLKLYAFYFGIYEDPSIFATDDLPTDAPILPASPGARQFGLEFVDPNQPGVPFVISGAIDGITVVPVAPIPEPGSFPLFAALGGLGLVARAVRTPRSGRVG